MKLRNVRLSLPLWRLGIDTREDFLACSFMSSLGGYVTGRMFQSFPVNGTSFFSKKVEEVLEESTLAFLDFSFSSVCGDNHGTQPQGCSEG